MSATDEIADTSFTPQITFGPLPGSARPYTLDAPQLNTTGMSSSTGSNFVDQDIGTTAGSIAVATAEHFQMMGMDAIVDGLYDTWNVVGTPDYAGAAYSGGLNTPLRNVSIATRWIPF
ncbi:MAG: hypothetical protein BWY99_02012 [Synergistetes bacterium ADurb.BinA166]|nr:MAG: hypothetical protein BWY99_02012 [Synergistetes bacterium ADurb.BinA166]